MSKELFANLPGDVYGDSKNEIRREYEKRLREVKNQAYFKQQFGMMMKNVSKGISFDVDTKRNIERKNVSALEFQLQYFNENKDKLSIKDIKNNLPHLTNTIAAFETRLKALENK